MRILILAAIAACLLAPNATAHEQSQTSTYSAKLLKEARVKELGALDQSELRAAARLYRTAAERGEAEAMYHMGRMFESGTGYAKDLLSAQRWYLKALRAGWIEARVPLARLYLETGTASDKLKVLNLLDSAAQDGVAEAHYILAILAREGRELPKDHARAIRHFITAASQGSKEAAYELALSAETGDGTKRDLERARSYYEQAARAGLLSAQYRLGKLLSDSPTLSQNAYFDAYVWLNIAVARGCSKSPELLERIAGQLDEIHIRQAQTESSRQYENIRARQKKL